MSAIPSPFEGKWSYGEGEHGGELFYTISSGPSGLVYDEDGLSGNISQEAGGFLEGDLLEGGQLAGRIRLKHVAASGKILSFFQEKGRGDWSAEIVATRVGTSFCANDPQPIQEVSAPLLAPQVVPAIASQTLFGAPMVPIMSQLQDCTCQMAVVADHSQASPEGFSGRWIKSSGQVCDMSMFDTTVVVGSTITARSAGVQYVGQLHRQVFANVSVDSVRWSDGEVWRRQASAEVSAVSVEGSSGTASPERPTSGPQPFTIASTMGVRIRVAPQIHAAKQGDFLAPCIVFMVSAIVDAPGGQRFLKLADGRGWAFTRHPGNGSLLCAEGVLPNFQVAPVPAVMAPGSWSSNGDGSGVAEQICADLCCEVCGLMCVGVLTCGLSTGR